MSPRILLAPALILLLAGPAGAQARLETAESSGGGQAVERAVPRGQAREPRADAPTPRPVAPRSEPAVRARTPRPAPPPRPSAERPRRAEAAPVAETGRATAQEQAVPRDSRPQGDNPRTGTAVPRGSTRPANPPVIIDRGRGPTIIVRRPPIYTYYYPQRYYPYGYGGFGLGYFYYDPYTWYPGLRYDYRYLGRSYADFDTGELRLRVRPRDAQVFVDGYFAGIVDDYDGTFQAIRLPEGPYKIEIVKPGYRTLEFDVRITRGRKITYRGELEPERP